MKHPQAASAQVLLLDPRTTTEARLDPEAFEAMPLVRREPLSDPAAVAASLELVERAEPRVSPDALPDVRFGLLAFDDAGRRVRTVYVDKLGGTGVVDGEPVRFGNDVLIHWFLDRLFDEQPAS